MKPSSRCGGGSSLAVLLVLVRNAPAAAFNSYLAGLKYYQLGNFLTNVDPAPSIITDTKPLANLPEPTATTKDSRGDTASEDVFMSTTTTTTISATDEYVRGTFPMLLGDALPDLLVPATTSSPSAPGPEDDVGESRSAGLSVPKKVASAVKSGSSYSPFGAHSKSRLVFSTNTGNSGNYLDRLRNVKGGIEFSPAPNSGASSTHSDAASVEEAAQASDGGAVEATNVPRKTASFLGFGTKSRAAAAAAAAPAVSSGYLSGLAGIRGQLTQRTDSTPNLAARLGGEDHPHRNPKDSYDTERLEKTRVVDSATPSLEKLVTNAPNSRPIYTEVIGIPNENSDEPELGQDQDATPSMSHESETLLTSDSLPPSSQAENTSTPDEPGLQESPKLPSTASKYTVFGRKPQPAPESVSTPWMNSGPVRAPPSVDLPTKATESTADSVAPAVTISLPARPSEYTVFGRKPQAPSDSVSRWMNAGSVRSPPADGSQTKPTESTADPVPPAFPSSLSTKAPAYTVFGRKPLTPPRSVTSWMNAGPVRALPAEDLQSKATKSTADSVAPAFPSSLFTNASMCTVFGRKPQTPAQSVASWMDAGPVRALPAEDLQSKTTESTADSVAPARTSILPPKASKYTVFGRKPQPGPKASMSWTNAGPVLTTQEDNVKEAYVQPAAPSDSSVPGGIDHHITRSAFKKESKFTVFGRNPMPAPDSVNSWGNAGPMRASPADIVSNEATKPIDSAAGVSVSSEDNHAASVRPVVKESKFTVFGRKPKPAPVPANSWMIAGPARASSANESHTAAPGHGKASTTFSAAPSPPDSQVSSSAVSIKKPSYSGFGVKPTAPDTSNELVSGYLCSLATTVKVSGPEESVMAKQVDMASTLKPASHNEAGIAAAPDPSDSSNNIPSHPSPKESKKPSYSGFGVKHVAKSSVSSWEPASNDSSLVPVTDSEYLTSMAPPKSSFAPPKASFTGFGVKPIARARMDGYLQEVPSSHSSLTSAQSGTEARQETARAEPEPPAMKPLPVDRQSSYLNVGQSILPVTSAESTWVSGKSLRESSGATGGSASASGGQGASSFSSLVTPQAPAKVEVAPLPLINSYSPTQWTLNRGQPPSGAAVSGAVSPSAPAGPKIYAGSTIESIDSSLKAVDFAPPPAAEVDNATHVSSAVVVINQEQDRSDSTETAIEQAHFGAGNLEASSDVFGSSSDPRNDGRSSEGAAEVDAQAEIREIISGATSYLASLKTPTPHDHNDDVTTSIEPHGSPTPPPSSYLGFGKKPKSAP